MPTIKHRNKPGATAPESAGRGALPLQQAPDSLCILRFSALGDVTHTVPVVRAIQQAWPQTRITWIIGKLERRLLGGLEGIEFIVFDKSQGFGAYRQLRRDLKGRRFDVLLHMQVAARANLASLLVRAPLRLGWDRARSRDQHHWFINQQVEAVPQQHQVQGFFSFARALGLAAQEPHWDLPVGVQDQAFAERHLPGDQPTLLISACSSHALRNWRPERYAEVADHAIEKLGMRVLLSGGPAEAELAMAAAIEAHMQHTPLNLVGEDTLTQSLALLRRATVVLSPDSGPAHMANAMGTPVIGLYACTWSRRSGPYNSLFHCVDHFSDAARQYRQKEPEALRWGSRIEQPGVMDLVKVTEVIQKLEQLQQAGD